MRLGLISADWSMFNDDHGHPIPGGSGYYRTVMPARELKANGIDVVVGGAMGVDAGEIKVVDFDQVVHGGCDIIVFQRWMGEEAPRIIKRARALGQVVINDIDDWYEGMSTTNRAWNDSHPKNNPLVNRDHYKKAILASSGLIVSTPYLAQRYAKLGIPIEIVRNAIDIDRWMPGTDSGSSRPTVGWVGATSWRSRDLEILKGVLGPFLEKNELKFIHGGYWEGAPKAVELLGLSDSIETESRPMVPVNEYPSLFPGIDIGIAPLSRNSFNESKSAIKAMEYAAAGIPCVSSDMPEYGWLSRSMGIGAVAEKPKDWVWNLQALLDPEVRSERARKAREAVKELDVTKTWTNWFKAYLSIFSAVQ